MAAERFFLVTGCSCAGKTSLVEALEARGVSVIPEPGRRIIAVERAEDGNALPWRDMAAFARKAVDLAQSDLAHARTLPPPVFFDRGLIDAAVALQHAAHVPLSQGLHPTRPYHACVFVAAPWPDLFAPDDARRHDFAAAKAEYHRITATLDALAYTQCLLPQVPIAERVDFVLDTVASL